MANVQKKENLTIAIREYQDPQGQTKKVWKTIGELITWDDGSQSFETWIGGTLVKGSVFEQQQNNQGQQPQQQGGFNQQTQNNGFNQNQGGFNQNNGFNQG